MLTFVTSLRHPQTSESYEKVLELFYISLGTMLGQSHDAIRVIVVCNEIPPLRNKDPRVTYHKVDFPPPSNIRGRLSDMDLVRKDKGSKLLTGILLALQRDPDYIAIVDADDWVHRDLASQILASSSRDGWYVNVGYLVNRETLQYQKRYGMVRFCGSTIIHSRASIKLICADALALTQNATPQELIDATPAYVLEHVIGDHPRTLAYCHSLGLQYLPIPFPSLCWVVNNGENSIGANIRCGRPLSAALCDAFSLGDQHAFKSIATPLQQLSAEWGEVSSWIGWQLARRKFLRSRY